MKSRHIIVCVDGVGFATIEQLRAEGRFTMFRAPSRMISSFPSLTNLAMTAILRTAGAAEVAGYEETFFDIKQNRLRGNIVDRFRRDKFVRGTFRELFDYHPSALKSGLGYVVPPASTYLESLTDLIRLRQKARASRAPVFFAYTGATDSLAHVGGERYVRSFLRRLDECLQAIVKESDVPATMTLFSDHGNHYCPYRRVSLKSPMREAGFRLEKSVHDEQSVVFPQFGLVGCAVLFTRAVNEARLAESAAQVEGVDFAAYENGGIVSIVARDAVAQLERRGERYRYRPVKGDALGFNGIVRALAARGEADEEGFISDAGWFQATAGSARPDAVRRIYEGLTGGVTNRANVIVNFADGYYTGSALLDAFGALQATHGNLGPQQSLGFLMSTDFDLREHVRAGDLWEAIGAPRLRQSTSR